jgi:hypothetical protein
VPWQQQGNNSVDRRDDKARINKPSVSLHDTLCSYVETHLNSTYHSGLGTLNQQVWTWVYQSNIFWDVTPCSPAKVHRRFEGTSCLRHQVWSELKARNREEAYVPSECRWTSTRRHGVTSQKIILFMATFVRTSNSGWAEHLEGRTSSYNFLLKLKLNSVAFVSEQTMLTERPPLVGEVSANFCGRGCPVVSATDPPGRILGFLDRSRYYFFRVAPQLSSRGWVDPVPDPLPLRKSGSAGNRTRDFRICSQKLWPLDHRDGLQFLTYGIF